MVLTSMITGMLSMLCAGPPLALAALTHNVIRVRLPLIALSDSTAGGVDDSALRLCRFWKCCCLEEAMVVAKVTCCAPNPLQDKPQDKQQDMCK